MPKIFGALKKCKQSLLDFNRILFSAIANQNSLFANLVAYCAACFASRLTARTAFTATAVFSDFVEFRFGDCFNVFHNIPPNHVYYTIFKCDCKDILNYFFLFTAMIPAIIPATTATAISVKMFLNSNCPPSSQKIRDDTATNPNAISIPFKNPFE